MHVLQRTQTDPNNTSSMNNALKLFFSACCCELFLIVGTLKSFGLFFVEFLRVYDTTASMVSIVLSIQTAMFSFSGKFTSENNKYTYLLVVIIILLPLLILKTKETELLIF